MATLIKIDGTQREVSPKNGTDFQLEELYNLLSCHYVDIVRLATPGQIMIIDEEGKLKRDAILNDAATFIYRSEHRPFHEHIENLKSQYPDIPIVTLDAPHHVDTIYGDVIICWKSEFL